MSDHEFDSKDAENRSGHWETLDTRVLIDTPPWVTLLCEQVRLPSGRIIDDFYRVILPDFACIVPVTESGHIVMVRGYKHGMGRINLSPPAGLIEPNEEPLECAQRELLEETGYSAPNWVSIGDYVVDGNRRCGVMHLFLAQEAKQVQRPQQCDCEQLEIELLSPQQVKQAVCNGEIGNLAGASSVAIALLFAQLDNATQNE